MDNLLIESWNATVKDSDDVYILGDFCWTSDAEKYINRLNGRLKFITGNHDIWIKSNYLKRLNIKKPIDLLGNYKEIRYNKTKIVLCHYPIVQWNRMQHGSWHLYGHMHGALELPGKALDVGIDNRKGGDMKPFSIEEIETYMSSRPIIQHSLFEKV
jgi:calcineurin-like phosphoesterase family protein